MELFKRNPNPTMRDIFDYCLEKKILVLAQGMIELPPPPKLRSLLSDQLLNGPDEIHQYRARKGEPEILDGLIKFEKEMHQLNLKRENLFVTSGVSAGIAAIILHLRSIKPNPKIAVLVPFYTYHIFTIKSICGSPPLFIDTNPDFSLNFDNIETTFKNGLDMLLFANPGNPTGHIFRKEEIQRLVKLVHQYNVLTVFDEIYCDLIWDVPFYSPVSDALSPNILVCRGFSKTLGTQSWRIGYMIGTSETIEKICSVHDPIFICVPLGQQATGIYLKNHFEDFEKHLKDLRLLLKNNWKVLREAFVKTFGWQPIEPEGAMYGFFKHSEKTDLEAVGKALDAGVGVAPGNIFFPQSPACSGYIRIHCGISHEKALLIAQTLTGK